MTLETTNLSINSTSFIDTHALRDALGSFATGVTILTALLPSGEPTGFTANSFTSVSLDPPLILACIAKSAAGYEIYNATSAFCVNILAHDQRNLSATFAARGADKFRDVPWRQAETGSPILEGGIAHFDCEMHQTVEAGDHAILIGRVVDFSTCNAQPLCYHRGKYAVLAQEHPKPVSDVAISTSKSEHHNRTPIQQMGVQS